MIKPSTYCNVYWNEYKYKWLSNIETEYRFSEKQKKTLNSIFIMLDTETSKSIENVNNENHVVYFTISANYKGRDLFTLHGSKPSEAVLACQRLHNSMPGEQTFIYVHNLGYDWTFLRRFFFMTFGHPIKQLNTKSHYPIYIEFENGIILRDSLILAQRKLEQWGSDLKVKHQKAVGFWDYNKYRNQQEEYTDNEHKYAEFDTLCGVECLEATRQLLGKRVGTMPWTATGIPREEIRKRGKKNRAKEWFNRVVGDWRFQKQLESAYHGGFTHANRHYIGHIFRLEKGSYIQCFDFASSYPFCLLAKKYPSERFFECQNTKIENIIKDADEYAFCFKLVAIDVKLKDDSIPMPALQFSKCEKSVNDVTDNGRILYADYIEIYLTEQDLIVINEQYDFKRSLCIEVMCSKKDYLPRWFTDYVFELFENKTKFKGGDKVLYALAKALLNSLYGVTVQKPVKDDIIEVYEPELLEDSKSWKIEKHDSDYEETYNIWKEQRNNILPYFIGVWVTAYAFRNLFELGKCVEEGCVWIYSDTDSAYSNGWNLEKVNAYNEKCKQELLENGYGCVHHMGREWWLGVAETDGDNDLYSEFVTVGAKRYCGRKKSDDKIHITVAGVPKKGAECLNNDIKNFKKGFIFSGNQTGKLTHEYIYSEIHMDSDGNEIGDSINLMPCDYLLDDVFIKEWEDLISEDIDISIPGLVEDYF